MFSPRGAAGKVKFLGEGKTVVLVDSHRGEFFNLLTD